MKGIRQWDGLTTFFTDLDFISGLSGAIANMTFRGGCAKSVIGRVGA